MMLWSVNSNIVCCSKDKRGIVREEQGLERRSVRQLEWIQWRSLCHLILFCFFFFFREGKQAPVLNTQRDKGELI